MPSPQNHPLAFTPSRQLQPWTHDDSQYRRPSTVQTETLRPMEPASLGNAPRPYLPASINDPHQPRQQLPGLQELLSPSLRTGPPSYSHNWPSVNNSQSTWSDGLGSSANGQRRPSQVPAVPFNPTPPPFHRLSLEVSGADRFSQPTTIIPLGARPSFSAPPPPPPLRNLSDYPASRLPDQLSHPTQGTDTIEPSHSQATSPYRQENDGDIARRLNATQGMRNAPPPSNYSLQCVGQRHIPGEGMCYVFKDGSTCPTIIDGEPVNPLWGTTKAGKARKRLAQACL
jgi:hypothetical protein